MSKSLCSPHTQSRIESREANRLFFFNLLLAVRVDIKDNLRPVLERSGLRLTLSSNRPVPPWVGFPKARSTPPGLFHARTTPPRPSTESGVASIATGANSSKPFSASRPVVCIPYVRPRRAGDDHPEWLCVGRSHEAARVDPSARTTGRRPNRVAWL